MNNRLKELRLAKKMTQQELADAVHTTKANVCMIENNKRNLTASSVLIFANYFGVSTDYLLGNTDNNNRVKDLRLAHRLTLRELAEQIGLDHSAVSRIENGGRNLSDSDIVRLCNFFNVSADYLLGRVDNPKASLVTVADQDGTVTRIQHQLIDATKGLTIEDMEEIFNYVDYLKSKKGNK